jgi:hypothetical protein
MFRKFLQFGLLLMLVGMMLTPTPTHAATVFTNYPGTLNGDTAIGTASGFSGLVIFTVPNAPYGYHLNSVQMKTHCTISVGSQCDVTVGLYTWNGSLGSSLVSLSMSIPKTASPADFTTVLGVIVQPNQTYAVTLNYGTGSGLVWKRFTAAPTGGFTYGGSRQCTSSCTNANHLSVQLDADTYIPSPSLISPAHLAHTTDKTPTFTWSAVTGATTFRIFIYNDDRSFNFKKAVVGTSYTVTTPLTAQKYLWRVRSKDEATALWGGWSQRRTLFVD